VLAGQKSSQNRLQTRHPAAVEPFNSLGDTQPVATATNAPDSVDVNVRLLRFNLINLERASSIALSGLANVPPLSSGRIRKPEGHR
jgi:hypothetical protein